MTGRLCRGLWWVSRTAQGAHFLCGNRTWQWQSRVKLLDRQSLLGPTLASGSRGLHVETGPVVTLAEDVEKAGDESLDAPSFSLRPYQEAAIQSCVAALERGARRIGVSSPTGSGKTTIFMNLIPHVVDIRSTETNDQTKHRAVRVDTMVVGDAGRGGQAGRGQTLILVNGIELAQQAGAAGERLLPPGWTVELEQGNKKASGFADVTVATFQTLLNLDRLKKFDPSRFELIIVDEAHHAAAKSYLRILQYFNSDITLPRDVEPVDKAEHDYRTPIIGFSATFSRHDSLALSAVFEEIVFHRDVKVMLDEGWLCPAKATSVQADLHLDEVDINPQTGDFATPSLAQKLNTPEITEIIVRTYLHLAESRRSTLVFCVDLDHVDSLTAEFRRAGVDARSVSSRSHPRDRQATIKGFSNGEFPVLLNCEVLTEGTDIPVIDCVLLVRPTKSRNLLVQMVGRGLRLSPATGKEDCYIIDIVDNVSKGITATPTLLGLSHEDLANDQREEAEEEGVEQNDIGDRASQNKSSQAASPTVTLVDVDDPFGLTRKGTTHHAQMSSNAWVACGQGIYVIEIKTQDYLRIHPSAPGQDGAHTITHTSPKIPFYARRQAAELKIPYKQSKVLAGADDLQTAFRTADTWLEQKLGFKNKYNFLDRKAPWRLRGASVKAAQLLWEQRGVEGSDVNGPAGRMVRLGKKEVRLSDLSAGAVANAITAWKHGAIGRRKTEDEKEATQHRRMMKKKEREEALAARNLPLPPSD